MEKYLTNPSNSRHNNISDPLFTSCMICSRNCGVNRSAGRTGYCGQTVMPRIARAALHFWEEPCISGTGGSGTVFFVGCSLGCIFCQNHMIAHTGTSFNLTHPETSIRKVTSANTDDIPMPGTEINTGDLAQIFLSLQEQGAHNINLVTPTHFVPQIIEALDLAKSDGLNLPIVYNSSCYEKVETLKRLDGLIDIYLPDMKYRSDSLSHAYANAPDYFSVATAALAEMYRQIGKPVFENKITYDTESGQALSETALMKKGVIVRHLLLPGHTNDSCHILQYLYETYGDSVYISIMNQYTPMSQLTLPSPLNRKVTAREYNKVVDYAISLGITNAFIQDGPTASESFVPFFYSS